MIDLMALLTDLAWPMTILIAWFTGEYAFQCIKLPRISAYAVIGFVFAPSQAGLLPSMQPTILLIANIAFGLFLFECGYHINLRWLRANPWILVTSVTEAMLTFASVYFLATWLQQTSSTALLLAALSMATSPVTIIRVINEQRSSGQVTERILHLSTLNFMLSVLTFKVIVGLVVFRTSGNLWEAIYSSLIVLLVSLLLGGLFGLLILALQRKIKHTCHDSTITFTIGLIFLVALAHGLKLSPVLSTLTFGLSVRHRRIALNASQRGFGAVGDLLSVLLFVFIAATLEWRHILMGIGLGAAIITVRQMTKTVAISLWGHVSGISWRKGLLLGMATAPVSAFAILVLEQTQYLGIHLVDQLAPLAAAALIMEILGPVFVQRALVWAHEVPEA